MGYGIKLRVWGEYACFSRPELKVERVSYDFITPSAARGLLEAIYWKPAIIWVVDRIHVIKPVRFTNIRRNEISETAKLLNVKKAMGQGQSYDIDSNAFRHQRAAMVLRDVEYIIEAHFEINHEKAGSDDTCEKHYNIALRRMRNGQFFHKPCLGTREFAASCAIIEDDSEIPTSALSGEHDFGFMLLDINYKLDEKREKQTVSPSFFRAKTINGICDLTEVNEVVK